MKRYLQFLLLSAALSLRCSNPAVPAAEKSVRYSVQVPSMGQDSIMVKLIINDWEHGDTVCFAAPPIYGDNPMFIQTNANFLHVSIRGGDSADIPFRADSVQFGNHMSPAFFFPKNSLPATIRYYVRFNYSHNVNTGVMPMPGIRSETGYLLGNHLFAVPLFSRDLTVLWRYSFPFKVNYELGETVRMHGDPESCAEFRSPYELLFSTSALGGTVLFEGTVSGQPYRCVHLGDAAPTASVITKAETETAEIFSKLIDLFGVIHPDHPITVITGAIQGFGGLEGTYAFSVLTPFENDTLGVFNMVMAHELIHAWIGIRVGEHDDPWWKEGTTTYLGFVMTKQMELIAESYSRDYLCQDLSSKRDVQNHCPSDEYVRLNIFSPDSMKNCNTLAYTKGAQISMLLDRKIRGNSSTSLQAVLGKLAKQYDGTAFYRADYLNFIKKESGVDVSDIFSRYVDNYGAIPDSVLMENYNALARMGAFGVIADTLTRRDNLKSGIIIGKF